MSRFSEATTIQHAIVARLSATDLDWSYVAGRDLDRSTDEVLLEREVATTLIRLNPTIAEQTSRVDEVMPQIRAALLSVGNDGLVASNERMVEWLRGNQTHKFIGTDDYVSIKLIDFENPANNTYIVSDEVTFIGLQDRRFDVALWVNGFPLVIGETKTPTSLLTSWLDAAKDITGTYEVEAAPFFVPNVLSFATDGRGFRFGAVGEPPEMWQPWSATTDPLEMPPMQKTLRSVELLLTPQMVLDILRTYTLFTQLAVGSETLKIKVIPRYPQVEGVQAIVDRAVDPKRDRGLIWHHQGSGKTFLMAFAAVKLLQDPRLDAPTVLVVLDRLDLIEQTTREFKSAGVPRIREATTKEELRRLLAEDARGVIMTTIFRFDDASVLNTRSNIYVLVDEAHRTQEGMLGAYMRAALPNAKFFGLTGTPISTADRNTFALFGDAGDPGRVMNTYSIERSIADGATLPVHVETRLVDFHLDKQGLDEAFAEMAAEEDLSDEEREILIRKAGRAEAFLKNPDRIRAICEDVVQHWFDKLAPLGLKAQVVAFDRELCVEYFDVINAILDERHHRDPQSRKVEAAVVMTVGTVKGEPGEWKAFELTRDEEAKLKARFRDINDPLCFLIVTSKLLTGFDAPIEGVMYLDKPLRAHTLFQAITRTNRRWTNPDTGQEKQYGLVVDYVGVGREIVKSLQAGDPNRPGKRPVEITELHDELEAAIKESLEQFSGIDREDGTFETLLEAQNRIQGESEKATFVTRFLRCETLWEFLWPDIQLRQYKDDYQWLAKVYASVQPADPSAALLWHRLGAKTLALVHEAIGDVKIDRTGLEEVVVDEGMIDVLKQLGLPIEDPKAQPTLDQAFDTIERRLRAKLAGPRPHAVWARLSERLEALRRSRIEQATESVEFLKKLLELAKEVVQAEKAEQDGSLDEFESILPDPQKGALTQIFLEYKPDATPEIIERVVTDIDTIVRQVRFTGWQASSPADREVRQQVRKTLQKYGLPPAGPLFDRAYGYIRENY